MGAIATQLGIRISDGALFPYTEKMASKNHELRPWHGPMDKEWVVDTREARARRLKFLNDERSGILSRAVGAGQVIVERKPFNIATADKEELLEFVENEYGETLDARLPVLQLRRMALALATKQLEAAESAEPEKVEPAAPVVGEATPPAAEPTIAADAPVRRGIGRRAA